jgi:steroid delta-isomerase-like uncharacterized protein
MSVETSERVLREYGEALLSRGDFSRFFTDDVVWTTMETGDEIRGREAVRDYIVAMHTTLFDARPVIRNTAVGDTFAVLEADFVGKHVGEVGDVPATGKDVDVPYCVVYDIDGDRIRALRAYLPMAALMQQLRTEGHVPA